MSPTQRHELLEEDRALMSGIEKGDSLPSFDVGTAKYRELATGILFQFADSQLAGAAGYSEWINSGPTLADRTSLGMIVVEKMQMAKITYAVLASLNLNIDRYFSSHSWESRVLRDAQLGFRRASADKRLNALLYPIEGWVDLSVFAYLMSAMTCVTLSDFQSCSFVPLRDLADQCLPLETNHEAFGAAQLSQLLSCPQNKLPVQASLNYWLARVATSFGPSESTRNDLHRQFKLKVATNCQLREQWKEQITGFFKKLDITLPDLDVDRAAACN